jgi:hypothetical protein
MKKLLILAMMATVLLTSGCYKTQFVNGATVPTAMPAPGYDEQLNHNVIFGLVNLTGPVRLNQVCPTGWARVDVKKGPIAIVIGIALSFIGASALYEPQNISVWCSNGKGAHLLLDKKGHVIKATPISKR